MSCDKHTLENSGKTGFVKYCISKKKIEKLNQFSSPPQERMPREIRLNSFKYIRCGSAGRRGRRNWCEVKE